MPTFHYTAKNRSGNLRKGTIDATHREEALDFIADMGFRDANVRAFESGDESWAEKKAFNSNGLFGLLFLVPALALAFIARYPKSVGGWILPDFPFSQHLVGLLALVAVLFGIAGLVQSNRYRRGGILALAVFGIAVAMFTRHLLSVPL